MELILEYFGNDGEIYYLSIESYISFMLTLYVEETRITYKLLKTTNFPSTEGVAINFQSISYHLHDQHISSKLPIFVADNILVSGLCAVLRRILKFKYNAISKLLLGFKENCLMSPSEVSHWTRFCERDMIDCVKFTSSRKIQQNGKIPIEIMQFERELSNPVRIHNVYKVARLQKDPSIISGTPIDQLNIEHTFCHGNEMTLADFMLFTQFKLILQVVDEKCLQEHVPLVVKWFNNMKTVENLEDSFSKTFIGIHRKRENLVTSLTLETMPNSYFSFYKRDLTGFKHKHRIYTDQLELDRALSKLQELEVDLNIESVSDYQQIDDNLVNDLLKTGDIPQKRIDKKKSQLKSLVIEIIGIAKDGDRIVDFCSGTGHLGLLLAHLLPNCQITILENKEESINRAQSKSSTWNLTNINFFQCNLEYFDEDFNIGISLHGCGVATDIVLTKCFKKLASFVICPCCYGKIQSIDGILQIPQSQFYRENCDISERDFLYIAHCSDQTHDEKVQNWNSEKSLQGEKCMAIVDYDRKMRAEELGYSVQLKKLYPINCTPKNHLLVGKIC